VLVGNKLHVSHRYALAAKMANSLLECVGQSIASRSEGGGPSPLLSPGEAHLECGVQCWAPQYKGDVDILE